MSIAFNHTIVHSRDPLASATFFATLFGRPRPLAFGPFYGVTLDNEVTLDFLGAEGIDIQIQHYAFLVGEKDFDEILSRIQEPGLEYWADPGRKQTSQINCHYGGRGVYFQDPSGHLLEIMTRPYGREFPTE
jgi:catechol 2,3-dioxygenase-like lactoylglutathione lyase family enzyme